MNRIRRRDVGKRPLNRYDSDDDDDDTTSPSVFEIVDEETRAHHGHRLCWSLRVVVVLSTLCVMTTYLSLRLLLRQPDSIHGDVMQQRDGVASDDDDTLLGLKCPAGFLPKHEVVGPAFEQEQIPGLSGGGNAPTDLMKSLQSTTLGNWGNKTYGQVKAALRPWKLSRFAPHLRSGGRIYDSGTGDGWNLFITLDVLYNEGGGISNLTVLGNDYFRDARHVATTEELIRRHAPGSPVLGSICHADATNLSHIPSHSFDLVYTGHLRPLLDPLDLGTDRRDVRYRQLCVAVHNHQSDENDDDEDGRESSLTDQNHDWMAFRLRRIALQQQSDWVGRWVAEMARIARPGAPVIVEQVPEEAEVDCSNVLDFVAAGVTDRDFWKARATDNAYDWDVDPTSVVVEDDPAVSTRYNVFMRKRSQEGDPTM